MDKPRLQQQIEFIIELDKLKSVLRRTYLTSGIRHENSAEHSWHLAVMALLLAEHSNAEINVLHVLKMLLVHDVVEIDADDTFCYDEAGALTKADRETKAADRIFSLLPNDQAKELRDLWEEFEARLTPEAKFAAALDRVSPLIHNYQTQGRSWQEHGVVSSQVLGHNRHIGEGSVSLWEFVEGLINEAVEKRYLPES